MKVVAIIPVRGADLARTGGMPVLAGLPLLAHTVEAARGCSRINRLIVSTDSEGIRTLARRLGAEAPFQRPPELAAAAVPLDRVLKHCLEWLEQEEGYHSDIVVLLEMSHPIRPPRLLEQVIDTLIRQQLDTVFTAYEEHHAFWQLDQSGELRRVGDGEHETRSLRRPLYREVSGLALATRAEFIRRGTRLGRRVGVVPIREAFAAIDTQDDLGLAVAEKLFEQTQRDRAR